MWPSSYSCLQRPIQRRWRCLLLAIIAATAARGIGIPLALLTRRLVDVAAGRNLHVTGDLERAVWMFGAALAGLTLVQGLCRFAQGVLAERFAQRVIADLRTSMLTHMQRLSLRYYDRRAAGKIIIRFVGDAAGLRAWLARILIATPADVMTIVAVLSILGAMSWQLLLAAMVPPLALIPLVMLINPGARRLTREARREQSRLAGELTQRVATMSALKAARAEEQSVALLQPRIERIADTFFRRGRLDAWSQAASLAVGSMSLCVIGVWGSHLLLHGQASIGDIFASVWFTVLLRGPINRLTTANLVHQRARVAFERINALLNRRPEPGWDAAATAYSGERMRIRLKNVGSHDVQGRWVIRHLDALITGPGCVLIDGGAQETRRLFELILRLRRPHEGRIGLDGVNAKKLRLGDVRSAIRWVDDARRLVPMTLAGGSLERLKPGWEACAAMAPDASLEETTRGFDEELWSPPGPGAVSLRLALACALTTQPHIILLEHPTAGMSDEQVERFIGWAQTYGETHLLILSGDDNRLRTMTRRVVHLTPDEKDACDQRQRVGAICAMPDLCDGTLL